MNHWVMDYETLSNCFTAVFEHYKTEERKIFVIHELRDDRNDFIKCIIDKTAKDGKNGTSFQLYELYGQGLAFYFETRNIMFREIS